MVADSSKKNVHARFGFARQCIGVIRSFHLVDGSVESREEKRKPSVKTLALSGKRCVDRVVAPVARTRRFPWRCSLVRACESRAGRFRFAGGDDGRTTGSFQ